MLETRGACHEAREYSGASDHDRHRAQCVIWLWLCGKVVGSEKMTGIPLIWADPMVREERDTPHISLLCCIDILGPH